MSRSAPSPSARSASLYAGVSCAAIAVCRLSNSTRTTRWFMPDSHAFAGMPATRKRPPAALSAGTAILAYSPHAFSFLIDRYVTTQYAFATTPPFRAYSGSDSGKMPVRSPRAGSSGQPRGLRARHSGAWGDGGVGIHREVGHAHRVGRVATAQPIVDHRRIRTQYRVVIHAHLEIGRITRIERV